MAVGIDDTLSAAAAGVSIVNTLVRTIYAYNDRMVGVDFEQLIQQVRVTALQRIDEADKALVHVERLLVDKGVNLDQTLIQAISSTSFWKPGEAHRLKQHKRSFSTLIDATYDAIDDVAALLRCLDRTQEMGIAVVESAQHKHDFHAQVLEAGSVRIIIDLLKAELLRQKAALMGENRP